MAYFVFTWKEKKIIVTVVMLRIWLCISMVVVNTICNTSIIFVGYNYTVEEQYLFIINTFSFLLNGFKKDVNCFK